MLGSVNRLRRSTTTRTKFGERAFSCSGPVAWNSLSVLVREEMDFCRFKKKLLRHTLLV